MADKKIEGEGSYSGTKGYNERTKKFLEREGENIEDYAEDAAESLEGEEGEELRRAEREGKSKAKH